VKGAVDGTVKESVVPGVKEIDWLAAATPAPASIQATLNHATLNQATLNHAPAFLHIFTKFTRVIVTLSLVG
jgi:flagellar biosynthesis protein FliP